MPPAPRPTPPSRLRPAAPLLAAVLLAGAALTAGCGGEEAAPAEPVRVESPALGIAVVIPGDAPVEVEDAAGETIRLARAAEGEVGPGTLVFASGPPPEYGPNLVEAVKEREAELEGLPDGEFFGQLELGSQLGPAYATRGRFTDETGQKVEETRIYTVHPADRDRLMWLTYRYVPSPGDTETRRSQALEAFGWIEPLGAAGEVASEEAPAAEAPADGTLPGEGDRPPAP